MMYSRPKTDKNVHKHTSYGSLSSDPQRSIIWPLDSDMHSNLFGIIRRMLFDMYPVIPKLVSTCVRPTLHYYSSYVE